MASKKTIKLTESEMVSLIEGIVNRVKKEKNKKINESAQKRSKTKLLRERQYRLLREATEAGLEADIETINSSSDPEPVKRKKIEEFLDKLESAIKGGKMDIKKFFRTHARKVKRFLKNSKKKRPQVTTACQDFS